MPRMRGDDPRRRPGLQALRRASSRAPSPGTSLMRVGVAAGFIVVALTGCGASATTVTVRQTAAPARKLTVVHKTTPKRTPLERVCTKHVTVNVHASCGFAENVLSA